MEETQRSTNKSGLWQFRLIRARGIISRLKHTMTSVFALTIWADYETSSRGAIGLGRSSLPASPLRPAAPFLDAKPISPFASYDSLFQSEDSELCEFIIIILFYCILLISSLFLVVLGPGPMLRHYTKRGET